MGKQKFEIKFLVEGMHCASCAARVEKAVLECTNVESASVNLLRNMLFVQGTINEKQKKKIADEVCASIKDIGFNASVIDDSNFEQGFIDSKSQIDKANKTRRTKLIASIILTVLLMAVTMLNPIDLLLGGPNLPAAITKIILQVALSAAVIIINFPTFTSGFKSLFKLSPNMDTLVALGASISFIFGAVLTVQFIDIITSDVTFFATQNYFNSLPFEQKNIANYAFYIESCTMILTLLSIGEYLESYAKSKTTQELEGYIKQSPEIAHKIITPSDKENFAFELEKGLHIDNLKTIDTDVSKILKGDLVVVKTGDKIPCDGTIIYGSCSVNESAFTGENIPINKSAKPQNENTKESSQPSNQDNQVLCATMCIDGYAIIRAEGVGNSSKFAEILQLIDKATMSKAPVQRMADKISGIFVPAIIAIATVVFIIWMILGAGFAAAINYAVCVLVISCPCALTLATPTALMVASGRATKNSILIKSASILERVCKITDIFFDKTGTLTQAKFEVKEIFTCNDYTKEEVIQIAATAEKFSSHPIANAILSYTDAQYKSLNEDRATPEISEIAGLGISYKTHDTHILVGNKMLMQKHNIEITINETTQKTLEKSQTLVYIAKNEALCGVITLGDTIKEDAKSTVQNLQNKGIKCHILSGDNEHSTKIIADQLDISDFKANLSPQEKADELARNKNAGFVGDGINDALVLKVADSGIALGAGANIALDSADIILSKDKLSSVCEAIDLSKATLRIIKQNLFWALIYNVLLIPIAAGILTPFGIILNPMIASAFMALSDLCVVGNALRLRRWKPNTT
ncbi:MAG: heavy metal translocating P-type ATPase [Coriobacteriales bacterium]|nr:heavy metal translocating P-type ATPase [Coriobacteriales bacterium]